MYQELLEEIGRTVELPSFPVNVARLLELLNSEDPSLGEAAELVCEDPGIAGRVLKLASSALFNPTGVDLTSVEHAVTRIGMTELRNLAATVSVIGSFSAMSEKRLASRVWRHSLTTGIAARFLVAECSELTAPGKRDNPYFLSALMHDVGILLLAAMVGNDYDSLFAESATTGEPLHEIEMRKLGFNHPQAGAALLDSWRLPEAVVVSTRYHHEPSRCPEDHRTNVMVLHIADWIADHQGFGCGEFGTMLCDSSWSQLGLSLESAQSLIEMFDQAAKDSGEILSIIQD
ncbi:MAG: HDOD domain-containing protein [bacterium]|nr:HDOD domain-containing protein [bacterium]